jgi:hypothetical protein
VSQQRGLQDFTFRGLQGQDVIGELISTGRSRGLGVIPWFEFGFMTRPDSELARRHRAWLTQKRDGGLTSISAAGEVVWLPHRHRGDEWSTQPAHLAGSDAPQGECQPRPGRHSGAWHPTCSLAFLTPIA